MVIIYEKFPELYQKTIVEHKGKNLSAEQSRFFGTIDNVIFFEFMEKYTREIFDHNVLNYINPDNQFRLTKEDLPKSARLFRGTNRDYLTANDRYRLDPTHDTCWSYSPYEAADWLRRQNNKKGSDIILISDFNQLIRLGEIQQTGAGVFAFHAQKKGVIKPLEILSRNEYQRIIK